MTPQSPWIRTMILQATAWYHVFQDSESHGSKLQGISARYLLADRSHLMEPEDLGSSDRSYLCSSPDSLIAAQDGLKQLGIPQ